MTMKVKIENANEAGSLMVYRASSGNFSFVEKIPPEETREMAVWAGTHLVVKEEEK